MQAARVIGCIGRGRFTLIPVVTLSPPKVVTLSPPQDLSLSLSLSTIMRQMLPQQRSPRCYEHRGLWSLLFHQPTGISKAK